MPNTEHITSDAVNFLETSFFKYHVALPSPSAVLERNGGREGIVKYNDMQLVVKVGLGREVNIVQALSMRFVRGVFPNHEVPVPEVFGWRICEPRVFIYMELIPGETVMSRWSDLAAWEKESIAKQIKDVICNLKRLKQSSQSPFLGSVSQGPVQDVYFRRDLDEGPFENVKDFNDRLEFLITPWIPISKRNPEDIGRYYRKFLPDDLLIQFCHGDLNLSNVLVSGTAEDRRVSGIIDWEQAGWYPEFWEYCKMHLGMLWSHDWRASGWIEKVAQPYTSELTVLEEFWSFRCP